MFAFFCPSWICPHTALHWSDQGEWSTSFSSQRPQVRNPTLLHCTSYKKMCKNNFLSIMGGICLWSWVTDSLPNRRMFLPTATNDQQQFRRLLAYRTRMAKPSRLVQDSVIHHSSQWISISFPKYFFLLGKHGISFTLFGWRSIPVILFFCGLSELRDTAKPLGFTALQC